MFILSYIIIFYLWVFYTLLSKTFLFIISLPIVFMRFVSTPESCYLFSFLHTLLWIIILNFFKMIFSYCSLYLDLVFVFFFLFLNDSIFFPQLFIHFSLCIIFLTFFSVTFFSNLNVLFPIFTLSFFFIYFLSHNIFWTLFFQS